MAIHLLHDRPQLPVMYHLGMVIVRVMHAKKLFVLVLTVWRTKDTFLLQNESVRAMLILPIVLHVEIVVIRSVQIA